MNVILRKSVAAALCASIAAMQGACASSGTSGEASGSTSTALEAATDGESLVRGIYFGTGPVAALFPELWKGRTVAQLANGTDPAAVRRALALAAESGEADAAQLDPEKLQELRRHPLTEAEMAAVTDTIIARMRERDPTFMSRFELALKTGDRVLIAEAYQEGQELLRSVVASANVAPRAMCDICWVDVAIAVYAVLAVAVFVVIPMATDATGTPFVGGLRRDVLVDLIARRVATN